MMNQEIVRELTELTAKIKEALMPENKDAAETPKLPKEGDRVEFTGVSERYVDLELGKEYEVLWSFEDGDVAVNDDADDMNFIKKGDYRLAGKAETPKLPKVGEIVYVLSNERSGSENKPGDIGKVTEVSRDLDGDDVGFQVDVPGSNSTSIWHYASEIRPATEEEIAKYHASVTQKPKVGDWVRYTRDDGTDLTKGRAYKVVDARCEWCVGVVDDVGDDNYLNEGNLEIIVEPTVFDRLGRAQGEYLKGDIVRIEEYVKGHPVDTIGTVAEDCGPRTVKVIAFDATEGNAEIWFEKYPKLVAPVSARVDEVC